MSIVLTVLLFIVGLALIIKGGDWFVDAAVWIAEHSGIPHFIIGATIVSLGTTLPELMVSIMGTVGGEVDMAVGNAVGSVTANIGLIMGISVVCIPAVVRKGEFSPKALLMLAAAVGLWLLCRGGVLRVLPSLVLLAIFAAYVVLNVIDARKGVAAKLEEHPHSEHEARERHIKNEMPLQIAKFLFGVAAIVVGSRLLISKGSALAEAMGVPSAIIGVTMVAIGTSLPELVTTITAIVKKEASMSIGNIIGANVIDLTLILPVCSLISGGKLTIGAQSAMLDMPACCIVALIAVGPPLISGKFYRLQGIALLAVYVAYMVILVTQYGV